MIYIRPLGIAQTVQNLQQLSKRLQNNIMRQAIRAATNVIAKPIKGGTYGAGRQKITGLLQRSQTVSVSMKGDQIDGRVRMRDVDVAGNSKVARLVRHHRSFRSGKTPKAMRAYYWWFLEKGTQPRRTSGGASRGSVTARPWVVPTFDAYDNAALDAFSQVLSKRVDEESANLPKGVRS